MQQTNFHERMNKLKVVIIAGAIAFILSIVATMFFTGTFSRNQEPAIDETTQAESAPQKETPNKPTVSVAKAQENNTANNAKTPDINLVKYDEPAYSEKIDIKPEKTEAEPEKENKVPDEKYTQLAKLYSTMKPENAASVMCELEPSMTEKIISKMNERTAGKILGAIADKDPSYAAKVSKLLANAG